ncbi:WXG100 family type VII secretion target [Nocardia bovistercoris]|uniref:Type VII secretion protein EsxR n=1 Tax=Nocardia bovistercoris TaxID=2785916 RepID=A0A931IAS8_9NOCA|nr:type VII secretion protein EsxR [Nocardia bovistercoris]MBH0777581.1 type VII secretion protein EsxR [Nocardia bovistercoris]
MLYDKATMTELYNNLNENYGKLQGEGQRFNEAAGRLAQAWEGNASLDGFQTAKGNWDTNYADTLEILNKVAAAVESALQRALGTDAKIGDGFAS